MTENLQVALKAINKWLFFGWNYRTVWHTWTNANNQVRGGYLPEFIVKVKWTCNIEHMHYKWLSATRSHNTDAYLVRFYAELDTTNRMLLMEWVMQNYNGEAHISF